MPDAVRHALGQLDDAQSVVDNAVGFLKIANTTVHHGGIADAIRSLDSYDVDVFFNDHALLASRFFSDWAAHMDTTYRRTVEPGGRYAARFGNGTASLGCAGVLASAVAALIEELDPELGRYFMRSETGVRSIVGAAISRLTFSLKYLILAAVAYLILVLVNTLSRHLVEFALDACRHYKFPFWMGLDLMRNLVSGTDYKTVLGDNGANRYAVARRKRVSIDEAVKETLNALKLQALDSKFGLFPVPISSSQIFPVQTKVPISSSSKSVSRSN